MWGVKNNIPYKLCDKSGRCADQETWERYAKKREMKWKQQSHRERFNRYHGIPTPPPRGYQGDVRQFRLMGRCGVHKCAWHGYNPCKRKSLFDRDIVCKVPIRPHSNYFDVDRYNTSWRVLGYDPPGLHYDPSFLSRPVRYKWVPSRDPQKKGRHIPY